jgi:hypoxanthine phosphoribosyltransferase
MSWLQVLQIIAPIIAVITFVFALWKWFRPILSRLLSATPLDPQKPVERAQLSYIDVQKGVNVLAERIGSAPPDVILGIDRGGAIVGGILAKRLRVPICLIPRCGKDLKSFDFSALKKELKGQVVLVVDDACRTGTTLEHVVPKTRQKLPRKTIKAAVLLTTRFTPGPGRKPETGLSLVDYYAYFSYKVNVKLPWDIR